MDAGCRHNRLTVGMQIARIRKAQGLSLRKLARMVNMDYSYICNIENGHANPSLDSLSKIASGLDVDLAHLFENPDDTDYAFIKDSQGL